MAKDFPPSPSHGPRNVKPKTYTCLRVLVYTTGSSSVNIMRSTGSTILHLPASFRHHLHHYFHHCTFLHANNFLRAIFVYTARERRRRDIKGGLEVACTKLDTRPSLRTSSSSWGLHRKIRPLLVKCSPSLVSPSLIPNYVPQQL